MYIDDSNDSVAEHVEDGKNADKITKIAEIIGGSSEEISENTDNTKVCNNLHTSILFIY